MMHHFFLFLEETTGQAINWEAIDTSVYVVSTLIAAIIAIVKWFIINPKNEEIQSLEKEIQRLQNEIDTRLQYPSYGLETAKLTELQMNREIDEIKHKYEYALKEKDEESADKLAEHLREIENLKNNLDKISKEHLALKEDLESSLLNIEYVHSGNALRLPTGFILLIRSNGIFCAVKAIDQSFSKSRGAFIKYYWWCQPNGSGIFTTTEVKSGYNTADESGKGSNLLNIGQITLPWSAGGEGMGWVYFKNQGDPETELELVVSNEIDITKINAAHYEFFKPHDGKPKKIKLRKK